MSSTGEAWIESPQKRATEIALVGPLLPAAGGIAVTNRVVQNIYQVERSLFPGDLFMMKKLGNPEREAFLHRWLRRAMVDELPQVLDVAQGSMSLIGPRADTPEHIDGLFDAVASEDPHLHDEWKEVRFAQKPGIISSYAVHSHRHNLEGISESARLTDDEALAANARLRATLDIADFHAASIIHDLRLVRATALMGAANYGHYLKNFLIPHPEASQAPTTKTLE